MSYFILFQQTDVFLKLKQIQYNTQHFRSLFNSKINTIKNNNIHYIWSDIKILVWLSISIINMQYSNSPIRIKSNIFELKWKLMGFGVDIKIKATEIEPVDNFL